MEILPEHEHKIDKSLNYKNKKIKISTPMHIVLARLLIEAGVERTDPLSSMQLAGEILGENGALEEAITQAENINPEHVDDFLDGVAEGMAKTILLPTKESIIPEGFKTTPQYREAVGLSKNFIESAIGLHNKSNLPPPTAAAPTITTTPTG